MVGIYTYTLTIKPNNDWQMAVILRKVCIIDQIAFLMTLYKVDNFKSYDKHIYVLAKKLGLVTKNIPVEILWS